MSGHTKEDIRFPAHIRIEADGSETVQTVEAHVRQTARYAKSALAPAGLGNAAYLAGLIHDAGKFKKDWSIYLWRASHGEPVKRGSVNHTFAGVRYLLTRYHGSGGELDFSAAAAELLAYAAGAHHGLFDCVDERHKSGFDHRMEIKTEIGYEESVQNFLTGCADAEELDRLFAASVSQLEPVFETIMDLCQQDDEHYDGECAFYIGFLARLLLSGVIEGDRRDTAEFMNGFCYPERAEDMRTVWEACLANVEKKLSAFSGDTEINRARRNISDQCRAFAKRPGGVYRLNVPTGAGKTLASLRYGLAHAMHHGKARIIFTSSLLTILDQNAKVIREYVGRDDLILEHHSNVIRETEGREELQRYELLAESWEAPIVLTTLVQLLNTLFSGKTTCIRRFHALVNSVIVIDEVQTVPNQMLTQFNLAVNFLAEVCGATVVLCSATQPCLEAVVHPLKHVPEDIVPYDAALWEAFRRTVIVDAGRKRMEDIPSFAGELLEETDSLLIVCNKKSEAEFLYRRLADGDARCFHLSASMCMAHRRAVLADMQEALAGSGATGEKVICVSTQVIEAGVDISFGTTVRLLAGMDSVVQTAGRCNRNRERSEAAFVYVVTPVDEDLRRLPDIKRAGDASLELLTAFGQEPEQFGNDLASDAAIRFYYRRLYAGMPAGFQDDALADGNTLYSLLSLNERYAQEKMRERYHLNQAFLTAGRQFQVFDSDTVDVVVPHGEGAELIAALEGERAQRDMAYVKKLLEKLKPYTVSLFQYQRQLLEKQGALFAVCGGSILALQQDFYDDQVGLVLEPGRTGFLEV